MTRYDTSVIAIESIRPNIRLRENSVEITDNVWLKSPTEIFRFLQPASFRPVPKETNLQRRVISNYTDRVFHIRVFVRTSFWRRSSVSSVKYFANKTERLRRGLMAS